jgi:flagellar biosynthesis anti-sigma factor FlgM
MQINGLQHAQAAHSLMGANRSGGATRAASATQPQATAPTDELDLSAEAQSLIQSQATSSASESGGIRWEKVNALRQAIAQGDYDSPERLSGAMDKFLDAYA